MINVSVSCLIILLVFVCVDSQEVHKTLKINNRSIKFRGQILKSENGEIEHFAKIPYAKPPVGKLRFRYPQEYEASHMKDGEIYDTNQQPNTCWQASPVGFDKVNLAMKLWYSETQMSEDCLYLSIWSPKSSSTAPKAVMIWIYGGSFFSGSNTLKIYNGTVLTSKKDIVLVSMQYRLGPLGFMYLDGKELPGNQALMDQRMAMMWVKRHIDKFGGDPNRITIFGESAGSVSVSLHVLSPLSQRYFTRAVLESSSALAPWAVETKENGKEKTIELARIVNCVSRSIPQLIECLKSVDAKTLIDNQFNLRKYFTMKRSKMLKNQRNYHNLKTDASFFFDIFFRPIIDEFFIPKPISQLVYDSSQRQPIEIMMGFNANEGMFFLLYGLNSWLNFLGKTTVNNPVRLNSNSSYKITPLDFVFENLLQQDFMHKYLRLIIGYQYNIPSKQLGWTEWDFKQVINAMDQLAGDSNFVCGVVDFASAMSGNFTEGSGIKSLNKVFMYTFNHHTEAMPMPRWTGVMHGYEIEYVFGMPFYKPFSDTYYSFTTPEQQLSNYVMDLWTNFAKTGNPTPKPMQMFDQTITWQPYTKQNRQVLYLQTPKDAISNSFARELSPSPSRFVATTDQQLFQGTVKSHHCQFFKTVLPSIISKRNELYSKSSNVRPIISPITQLLTILLALVLSNRIN